MQLILNTLAQSNTHNWLWLIGLTLGTLAVIFCAVIVINKFRSWLKSDIPEPTGSRKNFSLDDINDMRDKGLISNEEYCKLRDAYINCN